MKEFHFFSPIRTIMFKVCGWTSAQPRTNLIVAVQCTAGHEGAVGDLSCMSIFSACFGLLTTVQLPATTWSGQIWISCWILPHFDVRTISVAWKLKKLSNIFWQKIFFLLHPLSKGVAPLCHGSCFVHWFMLSCKLWCPHCPPLAAHLCPPAWCL